MSTFEAIAHVGGAVLTLIGLGWLSIIADLWFSERRSKRLDEEVATTLGVAVEDLSNEQVRPKVLEIASQRASSELLRNRLSDFCGIALSLLFGIGFLSILAILIAVGWFTITDSKANAIYAWSAVGVAVALSFVVGGLSFICLVLTGRFPYEANSARKHLAWVNKTRLEDERRKLVGRYKALQRDIDRSLRYHEALNSLGYVRHASKDLESNLLQLPLLHMAETDGTTTLRISHTYADPPWRSVEELEYPAELWAELETLDRNQIPDDAIELTHQLYERYCNIKEQRQSARCRGEHLLRLWSAASSNHGSGVRVIVDHYAPKEVLERSLGFKFERKTDWSADGGESYQTRLLEPQRFVDQLAKLFPERVFVCGTGWWHEDQRTQRKAA